MRKRKEIAILLLALFLVSCEKAPLEAADGACSPSFREVSAEPLETQFGYWRIFFSVALIGCKERLATLTPEELSKIKEEFTEPSEWSNLLLYADGKSKEFREKGTARVNTILGREVVSDVLICGLTIIDHNAPTKMP
jgi:hypothetical protein